MRKVFSVWHEGIRNPALPALVGKLRTTLRNCERILDVGCGKSSPVRFIHNARVVGLDGFAPAIKEAQTLGTHDEYFVGDVRNLRQLFPAKSFDASVSLDVIEHLPKEDGWRLLDDMEKISGRAVIIFTPNGFIPQHSKDGDLQEHLSGWTVQDFQQRGYKVLGMCGPKVLRGEYHVINRKPRLFWAVASVLADYCYSRSHPESAAALLAIKKLG